MADEQDPLGDIDPQMQAASSEVQPKGDDPFADLNLPPVSTASSGLGAFASHALRGVLPVAGGLAGAGAGAEAGAAIGAFGGPLGAAAGGAVGGIAGFFGGSYATEGAQEWGLHELPDNWQEAIGQSDRQQRLQETRHPIYSFLGGLAPYAITMTPGGLGKAASNLPADATTFQRIMANPVTSRVFGGAAMGGMELGQEEWNGETPNWAKIGISTGLGLVFNRPTKFGEYLTNIGAQPMHAMMSPVRGAAFGLHMLRSPLDVEPTVAQAGDVGVVGPGITESTFQGGTEQSVPTKTTAQNAAADEEAVLGAPPEPDLHAIARRLDPDLFERNDQLIEQRDNLRQFIDQQSNPPQESFADLNSQQYMAEEALRNANPNSPAARGFRAQLADIKTQRDELTRRQQAWESGEHADTPDITLARQHLMATEHALWDLGPQISASMRRAADHGGQIEEAPAAEAATPEATETPAEAQPTSAPATPPPQESPIIAERTQQLMAAGLPREQAEANARVEAAYYETLSKRFNGALGTPEEIYRARAAQVVGPQRTTVTPARGFAPGDSGNAVYVGGKIAELAGTPEEAAAREQELSAAPAAPEQRPVVRSSEVIAREEGIDLASRGAGRKIAAIQEKEIGALADWQARQWAAAKGEPELAQEQPEVDKELDQAARGKIRLSNARAVITLVQADASTFMHESSHHWLEQLLEDSERPEAPIQLRDDADIVREWLGAKTNDDITYKGSNKKQITAATRRHEKFASGFEQYLREGVAPSKQLSGVFAQFKDWLTKIYQTIKGLGAPISEEIRGVFDRMLAHEPQRTVYAETREAQPGLATIHETDAAETPPAQADAVADRAASELVRYVADRPKEVTDEITKVEPAASPGPTESQGEAATGAAGTGEVAGGGGESETVPGGGGRGEDGGQVGEGANKAAGEGAGVSRGGSGGRTEQRRPVPGSDSGSEQFAPGPAATVSDVEPKLVDLAGNIRVENLTDQQDIAQAIHDSAERNDEFSGVRGSMTKGQMLDLADSMGLDASKINEATLAQLFGGTQELGAKILAARRLVVQSADIVSGLMKTAAESGSDADIAEMGVAIARHDLIQSTLAGVTAEWGRAGNAFHSLLTGWEKAQDLNQLLKDNLGRDLFQLRMIAKLGKQLDTPGKVSKYLRDAKSRTFGGMVLEYWINGLISGLATHNTYLVGNAVLAAEKAGPETAAAWAIGALRSAAGRTGERVQLGEVGAQFKAAFKELPQAAQAALESYRTGMTTLLPGETARPQIAFQGDTTLTMGKNLSNAPVTWADVKGDAYSLIQGMRDGLVASGELIGAGGVQGAPLLGWQYSPLGQIPDIAYRGVNVLPLGTLARLPSRNVAAIHSTFRSLNYSMEINALAYRQAATEGLTGTGLAARVADLRQNPSDEMMEQAVQKATNLTLMGQGGAFTQALQKLTNVEVGGFKPMKFIDPFVHIAANIMDQSLVQRTPLGLLSSEIRADLMGKNGNIAQDTAAAKMLVGSALSIAFGGLAAEGLASGSGPADPNKAAMWRLAGNQAHSVRVGDIWYDVHRLGPMGMLMGVAADMYDVAHQIGTEDADVVGKSLMHAFTQNILDESFMRGPSDLIKATTDPDRYGASYVRNFLSSFLPYSVGMAQMARATDPYSRQARTIMDTIRMKTPGLSESLFPRRDIWGEPMPSGDALVSAGVTAIYERQMSRDPVNLAMLDIGIAPAPVQHNIRNVPLNDQQFDDYSRLAGRSTKMRLDAIVRSPDYQSWSNATKHEVIEEVIRQSREAARGMMMMKYPDIPREAAERQIARKTGQPVPAQ